MADPLPEATSPHDLRGAASFAVALVGGGLACSALYLWAHLELYQNDLPPLTGHGRVHTVDFYPWAATAASVVAAFFALRLLRRSLVACRAARLPRLTLLHVGTVVALLPVVFHVLVSGGQALLR